MKRSKGRDIDVTERAEMVEAVLAVDASRVTAIKVVFGRVDVAGRKNGKSVDRVYRAAGNAYTWTVGHGVAGVRDEQGHEVEPEVADEVIALVDGRLDPFEEALGDAPLQPGDESPQLAQAIGEALMDGLLRGVLHTRTTLRASFAGVAGDQGIFRVWARDGIVLDGETSRRVVTGEARLPLTRGGQEVKLEIDVTGAYPGHQSFYLRAERG